jgi:hypothetical protein
MLSSIICYFQGFVKRQEEIFPGDQEKDEESQDKIALYLG